MTNLHKYEMYFHSSVSLIKNLLNKKKVSSSLQDMYQYIEKIEAVGDVAFIYFFDGCERLAISLSRMYQDKFKINLDTNTGSFIYDGLDREQLNSLIPDLDRVVNEPEKYGFFIDI